MCFELSAYLKLRDLICNFAIIISFMLLRSAATSHEFFKGNVINDNPSSQLMVGSKYFRRVVTEHSHSVQGDIVQTFSVDEIVSSC